MCWTADLSSLPDVVATIEKYEQEAEDVYKKVSWHTIFWTGLTLVLQLLLKFPNSTRIIRHYAVFQEEVKNNIEYSQILFKTADAIEEELATKHRHRRHRKNAKKTERKK